MLKRLYWASCDGLMLGDTKEASPLYFQEACVFPWDCIHWIKEVLSNDSKDLESLTIC